MVDERDDSVTPAGTGEGRAHATDAGPDARHREGRKEHTINDTPAVGEPPAGDQPPTRIAGVEQSASSTPDDLPNLGDEGGGSRYGRDDAEGSDSENEYSGGM